MCAAKHEKPNNQLTLVEILEHEQPYRYFKQPKNHEVKLSDDDRKNEKIRRIQGSIMGLAIGDAVGAPVEFRPHAYMLENEVKDMQSGGTWGLEKGQWTDDTSMALCLAASLIVKGGFNAYDQLVKYRRWYRFGYMSSTGKCFDIGKATRDAITAFEGRRQNLREEINAKGKNLSDSDLESSIENKMRAHRKGLKFGTADSAGNGPLMRLAPIPCFFSDSYDDMMKHIQEATQLTHDDKRAVDACRFYAALIWYALNGKSKDELLDPNFYQKTLELELHPEIHEIAMGSYKKEKGYEDGIRGKGYVVDSLKAALWAFYKDGNNFKDGVLLAVNLGDDTDTTAAIYGQLAGAVYGIDKLDKDWVSDVYEGTFILTVAKGLYIKGENSRKNSRRSSWSKHDEEIGTDKTTYDQHPDATKCPPKHGQKTDEDDASNQATSNEAGTTDPASSVRTEKRSHVISES